jgi:phosphoglucomutase
VSVHPLAGKPAPASVLVDLARLERAYFETRPDPSDPRQRVAFGTSGHRGSSLDASFTESHILAITQAICDYRRAHSVDGPLLMGRDTHALSALAQRTALEVLAANGVEAHLQRDDGVTPTPAISRAILAANRGRRTGLADGIVVTPSHNPPEDGGFKYNPTHGGPAESAVTGWIEERANALLGAPGGEVKRIPAEAALRAGTTRQVDFMLPYVEGLAGVVDLEAIRAAGVRLGVDPLGGASLPYWEPIQSRYGLDLSVVNPKLDPTFAFMTLDADGRIRMDPSSPYAAAGLVGLRDRFQLAFGNDPDADRHGIVTPGAGLLNPNHYLAVAIDYLLGARPRWPASSAAGKTVVTSSLIDRVVAKAGRRLLEVPVGFKWFASGLLDGSLCFGGEESAGASFLCFDGSPWSTDKDGLIADLLAAEILARTGKDPGQRYRELAGELGEPQYVRIDRPATPEPKQRLARLSPDAVRAATLAGEPIVARLTRAPGNGEPIGGLKVVAASGWFAARPSGTEDLYKVYAESFAGPEALRAIVAEAERIVGDALA